MFYNFVIEQFKIFSEQALESISKEVILIRAGEPEPEGRSRIIWSVPELEPEHFVFSLVAVAL